MLEKAGKQLTNLGSGIVKGTKELGKQATLVMKAEGARRELNSVYRNLGEAIINNREDIMKEYPEVAEKADQLKNLIDSYESKIRSLRRVKICPNCGATIPKESEFCLKCGAQLKKEEDEEEFPKSTGADAEQEVQVDAEEPEEEPAAPEADVEAQASSETEADAETEAVSEPEDNSESAEAAETQPE